MKAALVFDKKSNSLIMGESLRLWCFLVLLGFAVAAKHLDNLVLVELGHLVACRTTILAWVELARFLVEYLAHCSSECQAAVAVDVDLANGALSSLAELLLRNTYCIGQLATVSVDGVDILLGNS